MGMAGRDFKWAVALIFLIAVGACWLQKVHGQRFHLELALGTDRQFTQKFLLTLESRYGGAAFDTLLTAPVAPFTSHGFLDHPDLEKLQENLVANGLWTIRSADEIAPEATVLYTRLTAIQGERVHTSEWRGLPGPQHRALASCLRQSPMGHELQIAIGALTRAKRVIQHLPRGSASTE